MKKIRIVLIAALVLAFVGPSADAGGSAIRRVALKADVPSWFTARFAQEVIAAGAAGVELPAQAKVPTSSLAFVGIRPGQQIILADTTDPVDAVLSGALCTSNFVFGGASGGVTASAKASTGGKGTSKAGSGKGNGKGGSGGSGGGGGGGYAIGTAGHCGKVGDKVFMIFAPLGIAYIGDVVKSTGDPGDRLAPDFALISIRPEHNQWVSPSMAHWGGPTGGFTGGGIQPVLHSGHGLVIGTGGTPRAGVAYQWGDEWRFEGAILFGDSGSAAIVAGGLAAGNITHIAVDSREDIPVWNGGTSITKILSLTGGLPLATCSLPVPWPAPGCPPV